MPKVEEASKDTQNHVECHHVQQILQLLMQKALDQGMPDKNPFQEESESWKKYAARILRYLLRSRKMSIQMYKAKSREW